MSNTMDWATREVEIACKKENPDRKNGEWDYGCACYESALKAYNSLLEDGHSGFSFSLTRNILIRLMNHLPLTPITDEDFFIVNENAFPNDPEWLASKGLKSDIQCPRMPSLFRYETLDGKVSYHDNDRAFCYDADNPKNTYGFGFFTSIIDDMFPITMPYYPINEKYELECSEALFDKDNGDFDTVALWSITTPSKEKIPVNRFWKESENGFVEIDYEEWKFRSTHKADNSKKESLAEKVRDDIIKTEKV